MALPDQNRLRKKKDLDTVFTEGNAVKSNSLFIKYKKNSLDVSRFAFIIPLKTVGTVAVRNRIKRVLSESVRTRLLSIKKGLDIVVTVRRKDKEDILNIEILKLLNSL